jgi:hypothetical protein
MRLSIAAVAFVVAGWVAVSSCGSDESPPKSVGEGCSLNSDCNNPLSCAFGKCHTACQEARDCVAPARCVKAENGMVCQISEEVACSTTASCLQGQICGSNHACIGGCSVTNDCAPGQTCATDKSAKVCAESTEVNSDGSVTLRPLDEEAGAGTDGSGSGGSGGSDSDASTGGSGGSAGAEAGMSGGSAGTGGIADSGLDVSVGPDADASGSPDAARDAAASDVASPPGTELWIRTLENYILVADLSSLVNNQSFVVKKQFSTLKPQGPYGAAVFDRHGNLWIGNGGALWRYPASLFVGASSSTLPVPDEAHDDFDSPTYSPALWLDRAGNLWSWHDANYALRLPASQLDRAATDLRSTPLYDLRLNVTLNWMAFDANGYAWGVRGALTRFDSTDIPPVGGGAVSPTGVHFGALSNFGFWQMDFDPNGNAWIAENGRLRRVAPIQLAGSADKAIVPSTDVTLTDATMGATLNQAKGLFFFDGEGNLWICGGLQYVLKFDAATLAATNPDGGSVQIAPSLKVNSPLNPNVHFVQAWVR